MSWVNGVRIRYAQEMVETINHGVDRIARHNGFSSPSNFRAQFRRTAGVTPSEYRATFVGRASETEGTAPQRNRSRREDIWAEEGPDRATSTGVR